MTDDHDEYVKKCVKGEGPPEGGFDKWEPFAVDGAEETERVQSVRGGVSEVTTEIEYVYWRRRYG